MISYPREHERTRWKNGRCRNYFQCYCVSLRPLSAVFRVQRVRDPDPRQQYSNNYIHNGDTRIASDYLLLQPMFQKKSSQNVQHVSVYLQILLPSSRLNLSSSPRISPATNLGSSLCMRCPHPFATIKPVLICGFVSRVRPSWYSFQNGSP